MARKWRLPRPNHATVVAYLALFVALGGTGAYAANTVFSTDIVDGEVKTADIGTEQVTRPDIQGGAVVANKINGNAVTTGKIADGNVFTNDLAASAVTAGKLAPDSVGSAAIVADSVGSSEIAPSVVGADELDLVHEHTGPATTITDTTAHDGSYMLGSASVACGVGEDLLSVSVDWTATGGHNERNTLGVSTIDRTGDPDTATVEVSYDGGATTATFQPVATCIF